MLKSKKGAMEVFPLISILIAVVIVVLLTIIGITNINKNKDDTENVIQNAENIASDMLDKIDDANKLTTTDMTRALDRFVFEYESFVSQANTIDDFSEHRMGNLLGIKTKQELSAIEVNTNSDISDNFRINKNTKYPVNVATAKRIISFYTNNNNFSVADGRNIYYSPEFGVFVISEDASVTELNKQLSNKDNVSENTIWLKLN